MLFKEVQLTIRSVMAESVRTEHRAVAATPAAASSPVLVPSTPSGHAKLEDAPGGESPRPAEDGGVEVASPPAAAVKGAEFSDTESEENYDTSGRDPQFPFHTPLAVKILDFLGTTVTDMLRTKERSIRVLNLLMNSACIPTSADFCSGLPTHMTQEKLRGVRCTGLRAFSFV